MVDVTGTYVVTTDNLDLPKFDAGTGRVIVRIGKRCFLDTADDCQVNAKATSVKCH